MFFVRPLNLIPARAVLCVKLCRREITQRGMDAFVLIRVIQKRADPNIRFANGTRPKMSVVPQAKQEQKEESTCRTKPPTQTRRPKPKTHAHARFLARQIAMARHKSAVLAYHRALGAALVTYRNLRGIARNAFDESDRIALSIQEPFPRDRTGFVQMARAFYETALQTAYLPTLTAQGVSETRLHDALTELDAFNAALIEHESARADALRATAERDTAVLALRNWRTRFRRRARSATRGRRDLQAKLALSHFRVVTKKTFAGWRQAKDADLEDFGCNSQWGRDLA